MTARMTAPNDRLQLTVRNVEVDILTGIYSEETHLPQALRISVTVDLDAPDFFDPDMRLETSKNYMDIRHAMTDAIPRDRHFTLIEAVRRPHCRDTVPSGCAGRPGRDRDRQARHLEEQRGNRHPADEAPQMSTRR